MDAIIVGIKISSVENTEGDIHLQWDDYHTDLVEQSIVTMDFSNELLDDISQDRGLTLTVTELRSLQRGITDMLDKIDVRVKL